MSLSTEILIVLFCFTFISGYPQLISSIREQRQLQLLHNYSFKLLFLIYTILNFFYSLEEHFFFQQTSAQLPLQEISCPCQFWNNFKRSCNRDYKSFLIDCHGHSMNITEGKCKNETPIYSNWLVHMYTHIVIRSIYSVYTDFSIYGFGMELGDLYNNNKNKTKTKP